MNEVRAAIMEARAIVQDEQSKFFDVVVYPSIDLGDMLKNAGDSAKALVSTYTSPELEQREKRRQAKEAFEVKLAEQKDKIACLGSEITQREQLIESKRQAFLTIPKEDTATLNALNLDITTHQASMRKAESDLVVARSQLEALQRSGLVQEL